MRKKFFVKTVALVVCLVFIGISASGLFSAEKKSPKIDFRLLMRRPAQFMTLVFPLINNVFKAQKGRTITAGNSSANVVKPTNDYSAPRGGDHD